jgi:hypothetical protein
MHDFKWTSYAIWAIMMSHANKIIIALTSYSLECTRYELSAFFTIAIIKNAPRSCALQFNR